MRAPDPFRYPAKPHVRRHGPQGYDSYESYRDWLRDEFTFRCIYCLRRERWTQRKGEFDIDHFNPQSKRLDLRTAYDNLVLSCHTCNLDKSNGILPDPHEVAYGKCIKVNDDGTVKALNADGEILIDELDLDAESKNEYRKWILDGTRAAFDSKNNDQLAQYLGLPADLPNLSKKRSPKNSRLKGIQDSWFERKRRGEVPEVVDG